MPLTVLVKATGDYPWRHVRYGTVPTDRFVDMPAVSEILKAVNAGELERQFRSAANDTGAAEELPQQDEGTGADEYEFSSSDHATSQEEA